MLSEEPPGTNSSLCRCNYGIHQLVVQQIEKSQTLIRMTAPVSLTFFGAEINSVSLYVVIFPPTFQIGGIIENLILGPTACMKSQRKLHFDR